MGADGRDWDRPRGIIDFHGSEELAHSANAGERNRPRYRVQYWYDFAGAVCVGRRFTVAFCMICPNCSTEFDGDACPECGRAVDSASSALISIASNLLNEGRVDQTIESLEQAVANDPRSYEEIGRAHV